MSDTNRKNKLSMLVMASLISTNLVFASDFKNNVVDVKINKENNNAVKVTIFTDKPYTEPVVVNKKANNKYVILMPETKSSLKSTPSITNLTGTISDVSVNTQSVNGGKGYTKIVITSDKAVTIVPKTQTSAVATPQPKPQVADTQKLAEEKAKQEALAKAQAQKLAQQKAQQEQAKKLAEQKARQEALAKAQAQKLAQQKAQQEQARKLAEAKARQEALAKAQAQKLAQIKAQQEQAKKLAEQKAQTTTANTNKAEDVNKPLEILKKEIETDKNANFANNTNDEILNKEINDNLKVIKERNAKKKKKAVVKQFNTGENQSVVDNIKAVLKDYQNISLWKLLLLASAITFPVVVIMFILGMDKKINKRIDASFRKEDEETPNYAPVYESTQPMQQIAEEVQNIQYATEQAQNSAQFNSFEEMLNQVEEPAQSFHEEQFNKTQANYNTETQYEDLEINQPEIITDEQFENDFEKEDFELEDETEEFITQEEDQTPVLQEEISPIQEEIQAPVVQEQIYPVQEEALEEYSPDGYISDFANVNDKDFFDELVLQSMAENNANGLPEESPADEIFNFMNDNSDTQTESTKEYENNTQQINNDDIVPIAFSDELIENTDNIEQPAEDDSLTMLTEIKLNDNTGLYLVNYDNFSSLVGHINDEYFVIKKFDSIVNSRITLKQAEKLKDATRYLVRVGKEKMVLEVTESSMNRLLDL